MRRRFLKGLLALLSFGGWGLTSSRTAGAGIMDPTTQDGDQPAISAAFELATLKARQAKGDHPYLEFFDNNTMSMGLYVLPAGSKDGQSPHDYDEVYVVSEGKAVLDVEGESFPASEGSVLFVKAHAKHHFHTIEEDLKVLVFFSKARPD